MSINVVGERPTIEAFELIGIPGRALAAGDEAAAVVHELARAGAQLVLVQTGFAAGLTEDRVDELGRTFGCLVLEIPGIAQAPPDAAAFRHALQQSLGVLG